MPVLTQVVGGEKAGDLLYHSLAHAKAAEAGLRSRIQTAQTAITALNERNDIS